MTKLAVCTSVVCKTRKNDVKNLSLTVKLPVNRTTIFMKKINPGLLVLENTQNTLSRSPSTKKQGVSVMMHWAIYNSQG